MTDAEFLARFDRHLARFDRHLERMDAHIERSDALMWEVREEMALTREEARRSRQAHEDLRAFTREITLRNERVWRGVMDRLDDMGDEIRAQTAAIWNMLDRLGANEATT